MNLRRFSWRTGAVQVLLPLILLPACVHAQDAARVEITDATVDRAVQKAVEFVKSKRSSAGNWEGAGSSEYASGDTSLALLALLYAGENPNASEMSGPLDWVAAQTLDHTYTYSVRSQALSLVPGKKYQKRLQGDLDWLVRACFKSGNGSGAYGYRSGEQDPNAGWDNSNSQYGVLGVWMALEAGLSAAPDYWTLVHDHWTGCQNADGGWGYRGGDPSTGSMTAAGVASLFVVFDQLYNDRPKDAGALLNVILAGLDWLGREFTATENPKGDSQWRFYYLYGVERVGRASGYKYFRNKDWFREGASVLLASQDADGSWRQDLHNTCFALLFLCHGRAPLLFNKLEHGNDWNNKPRDVAGLNRYAQKAFERLLNWQIVKLDGTLDDLMEAPVLYLTGETNWEFTDAQAQKLGEYCKRGGLIFAVAGNDSAEFTNGIRELARKAFPEYLMKPLGKDHPLFNGSVQYTIENPPPMEEVHNGVRTLLLLCPKDIAESWARYRVKNQEASFQLGCNVYLYATDKTTIKSRLVTANITPKPLTGEVRKIAVARIKYTAKDGSQNAWDVEPFGWTRLGNYLNNETNSRLLVTTGLTFDSPGLKEFKIAYISGTGAFDLSAEELAGLRNFVSNGGTLLADAAAGSKEFLDSFEKNVNEALKAPPKTLGPDSFLFTAEGLAGGANLTNPTYRRTARTDSRGKTVPPIKVFMSGRRLAVIYSPIDLSSGLLGNYPFAIRGLESDSALHVLRNMLLYASLSGAEKSKLGK